MNNSKRVSGGKSGYPFISLVDPENPVDPRYPAPQCWKSVTLSLSHGGRPVVKGSQEAVAACVAWEKSETLRVLLGSPGSQAEQQMAIFPGRS